MRNDNLDPDWVSADALSIAPGSDAGRVAEGAIYAPASCPVEALSRSVRAISRSLRRPPLFKGGGAFLVLLDVDAVNLRQFIFEGLSPSRGERF
jgi:hypothetical protein